MKEKNPKKGFPNKKKFDGENYTLGRLRKSKKSSEAVAKKYRDAGYSARVSPKTKGFYAVYFKKMKK